PAHVLVVGKQFGRVGTEHGGAAWLEAHHVLTGPHVRRQGSDRPGKDALAGGELPGGDPGQAAAHWLGRHAHPPSRVLEYLDGSLADMRMEVVAERIRPQ